MMRLRRGDRCFAIVPGLVDANGADPRLLINGETAPSVFSDTKVSQTGLDAIIAAVNV
jgi:hypothetical protein